MLNNLRIESTECSAILSSNNLMDLLHQGHLQELDGLRVAGFTPSVRPIEAILNGVSQCLVAFWDSTPVGLLTLVPDPDNQQTMISVLIVHEAYQRRGIARQLVVQALCLVKTPLAVLATSVNVPAIALYHHMGFTPDWIGRITEELPLMIRFRKTQIDEHM